ncbi:Trypsin-like peptidase domain-containing protein [Cyclobacterium lianum]|uniref:Trypsin-like peptidase domain-containing protein n=1 Tax=Cyclobacterium lianum TaxID=388280 RepID=A0A1M7N7I3_9BACT|nr:serine protease [Cyclobacterium lianum]SHM99023.1 Trypsin-like peptidase domain-containing protein [Cyclobacterium lianum]
MYKPYWILLVLLVFGHTLVSAQSFDPDKVKHSLVKVIVSVNNRESNALTGFLWKTPQQIVTSLHGMSPTGEIRVLYQGQAWRKARIKKVLQKADLVLLELLPGQPALPSGLVPIAGFHPEKVAIGSDVFALGYNGGATGSSSRQMKKGYVDPETLANLIPKKDKDALSRIGFPALDLNILYLEGSLLPGFSGAPVFDAQTRLIGIGDGGLEKGASNVSWIIPASYLAELENSSTSALPAGFENLTQLFSATAIIEVNAPEIEVETRVSEKFLESSYSKMNERPVEAIGFEFYATKNRSLSDMMASSDDPENIQKLADEFALDINIQLDYENMRFDIYEDINNGVVVAVPEGRALQFNPAEEAFQVTNFEGNDMQLYFYGMQSDFSQTDFEELLVLMGEIINQNFAYRYGMSGFTVDEEYSTWDEFEGGRKVAWILSLGNEYLMGQDGLQYGFYVYMTLLMTEEKTFMSIATIPVPVEMLNLAMTYGLDCNNPGMYAAYCSYFNQMFQTFAAAHLVNFAY